MNVTAHRHVSPILLLTALALLPAPAASAQAVSFTMNQTFLRSMIEQDTAQPTFRVRMGAHGPLHALGSDCEMHLGGTVQGLTLGNPPSVVVEFPNWCKFSPTGQEGLGFNSLSSAWSALMDAKVVNKTCDVTGFMRIFTEHASGEAPAARTPTTPTSSTRLWRGPAGARPLTSITC